ncbi:response regulator [Marinilabiliaceae bacterium ANBcel2]|nr:response regulator [Marinilabiliaceae bacterium ANBcel2]
MCSEKSYKILIAEDLAEDAEIAIRKLKKEGVDFTYRVVETEADFTKELYSFKPDIVISDYSMPTFNGMEALKIVRKYPKYTPFIMLTGSINEETAVSCMKAGANDYVLKEQIKRLPFAVHEALEASKVRQEKQAVQKELKRSIADYKELINGMKETVWLIDPQTYKIIDVNIRTGEQLEYKSDELIGNSLEIIDEKYNKEELINLIERLKSKKAQIFQTWHKSKSGKSIPVEINSTLINYNGKTTVLSVARDISDRLQKEKIIKETQSRLQLLSHSVAQSPVSIIITDSNGLIEYVNKAFTRNTGYLFEDVIGKNTRFLKSGKQGRKFYKSLWDTIKSGKEWHGEFINKKKSGELFWEDCHISPIFNNEGEITNFVSLREDITQKKQMISDLINAKAKAEESDRLKSAFLANVSHEIRTPMNGILGFLELLKNPKLNREQQKKYIDVVNQSGQRLLETINDIIEISKIESNQIDVSNEKVDLSKVMQYHYDFFQQQTKEKNLSFYIEKQIDKNSSIVYTDKYKVETILSNLIVNAIKYTQKGTIKFGNYIENNHLLFYISDTGAGIPQKKLNIIFNRFVQADQDMTRPYNGVGLGLSIAKGYVNKLNGEIWVDSKENIGSTFYFKIPYNPVEQNEDDTTNKRTQKKLNIESQKPVKILIAEDDQFSRLFIEALLEDQNIILENVINGNEAISKAESDPDISLILMDVKMPGMDGLKATKEIRKRGITTPIIIQTAYALPGDRDKAFKAGCNEYITKPINKDKLISMLKKLL